MYLLNVRSITEAKRLIIFISVSVNGFSVAEKERLVQLLEKYLLPTKLDINKEKVLEILRMDKKRVKDEINFILLNKIGEAVIKPISISRLDELINQSL